MAQIKRLLSACAVISLALTAQTRGEPEPVGDGGGPIYLEPVRPATPAGTKGGNGEKASEDRKDAAGADKAPGEKGAAEKAVSSDRLPNPDAAFREVVQLLLKRHVDTGLTADELYQAAIEGMMKRASLELQSPRRNKCESRMPPSNSLLSPQDLADMNNYLRGRIVGIGAKIDTNESGTLDVHYVFKGTPSERAGLRPRDRIVRINDRKLDEMDPHDFRDLFRGPVGSKMRVQVQRENQLLELTIIRDNIEIETVAGELLPPDIALVRVRSFTEETPRQARGILLELKNRNVRGLVLDLRQNGGGTFEGALQFLDQFVPNGKVVVQLEDRQGKREVYKSRGNPILNVPVVVLIDGQTASAAEVVARALNETIKAKMVGEVSYGKATAEELLPLKNGWSARISLKRILSPSGRSWGGMGLTPDVLVKSDPESMKQALYAATVEERLKQDLGLRSAIMLLMQ